MITVTPAEGRKVKDQSGREMTGEFQVDEKNVFWAALLRWKDIVPVKSEAKPEVAPVATSETEKKAIAK
ncbi:hypothetical protein [Acetobacter sp. DsW_063]|uniref:hypothetical protein n=1 Tax=Acetobacter sp. DsW_063 TaxID=1514894 RepID=UPI000A372892|nr:hypothetical protein [Acetobacter sp. DsW_063]OUJ13093.1 hypothetical protein HK28_02330 [Acetobacter sp. DsW_063]